MNKSYLNHTRVRLETQTCFKIMKNLCLNFTQIYFFLLSPGVFVKSVTPLSDANSSHKHQ